MMPLTLAERNIRQTIVKVGGGEETRKHLQTMGFVEGGDITVVHDLEGNLIVNVKDSRVALDKKLASKIMI